MSARQRLVVIGNGMLATRALEMLCAAQPDAFDVHVFGAERVPAYNRVLLSSWLADLCSPDELWLHAPSWYVERRIEVHVGDPVQQIDRTARCVESARGLRVTYDHLLIATGSQVAMPSIPGAELAGVAAFRCHADVEPWLREPVLPTVVVGGGVLGLETAYGLARRGSAVTLVHAASHLMDRQLDAVAGEFVRERLAHCGVRIVLDHRCAALVGDGRVRAVRLDDGREIGCERAIFATGIVPDIALARASGLPCGRGIVVDARMRTADSTVSAIGECAEQAGQCHGLLEPLYAQVPAWVEGLSGGSMSLSGPPLPQTRLKIPGIDVFVAGELGRAADIESVWHRDSGSGVLRELRLRQGRLVGVRLCGDVADAAHCVSLIRSGEEVAARRFELSVGCEAA